MNENFYTNSQVQAELIRSMIAMPETQLSVSKIIEPEAFIDPKLKEMFLILGEIQLEGKKEVLSSDLAERLMTKGFDYTVEDEDFFFKNENIVQPSTILAKLLKQYQIRSKIKQEMQSKSERAEELSENIEDLLGEAQRVIEQLQEELLEEDEKTFPEQIDDFLEEIQKEEEEEERVPSYYPSLDKYTGGWGKSQLITVAARTSVGKSVVATNCTVAAGLNGKSVLFFSLEMSRGELISRLVACKGFLKLNKIYPKLLIQENTEEWATFQKTIEELRDMKIQIDDTPNVTIDYIKARALEQSRTEEGVDLIIVDYIQLINTGRRGRSRQEEVAEISRTMKVLAKQLQVPIIIIAQLNRERRRDGDDGEDDVPTKADIRESAAIAADSDVVLIIHRKYHDPSTDPKALFILDKNRNGPADKRIKMRCMLDRALFQDLEISDSEDPEPLSSSTSVPISRNRTEEEIENIDDMFF